MTPLQRAQAGIDADELAAVGTRQQNITRSICRSVNALSGAATSPQQGGQLRCLRSKRLRAANTAGGPASLTATALSGVAITTLPMMPDSRSAVSAATEYSEI